MSRSAQPYPYDRDPYDRDIDLSIYKSLRDPYTQWAYVERRSLELAVMLLHSTL